MSGGRVPIVTRGENVVISEFSVIWISLSVIVLCWAVVRVNQKIDELIRNHKYDNVLDHTSPRRQAPGPQADRASCPPQS